jgi:hypothetical protein
LTDVSIRGLSEAAVARIDANAAAGGLSRNEYLRRRFEAERSPSSSVADFALDDLWRAADAAMDLDNPQVMGPRGSNHVAYRQVGVHPPGPIRRSSERY